MFIFIFIILSLSGKDVAMNVLINTAMITIYHRYYRDTLNRNWKDKRNKTLFKSIFCILSTELQSRQEMYLIIQGKYIHTLKIKLHAHVWACAHTYT